MQKCPNCGQQNRPGVIFCENCGASLIGKLPLSTKALDSDDSEQPDVGVDSSTLTDVTIQGTATFEHGMLLRLEVEGSPDPIRLSPKSETIFGRRDPATGDKPDIDLTPFAGYRMGVSRRHAAIRPGDENGLDLWDLGSSNGTFLNGQRLSAHRPYRLRDGDEIRLGQMVIHIFFEREASRTPVPPPAEEAGAEKPEAAPAEQKAPEPEPASPADSSEDRPTVPFAPGPRPKPAEPKAEPASEQPKPAEAQADASQEAPAPDRPVPAEPEKPAAEPPTAPDRPAPPEPDKPSTEPAEKPAAEPAAPEAKTEQAAEAEAQEADVQTEQPAEPNAEQPAAPETKPEPPVPTAPDAPSPAEPKLPAEPETPETSASAPETEPEPESAPEPKPEDDKSG